MSRETIEPDSATLGAAARIWSHLSTVECVAVLWMALRYDVLGSSRAALEYLDRMSLLPWLTLGEPLQKDIARALSQFAGRLKR